MIIAGLDIGTSTISGVLVDAETGSCIESITEPNKANLNLHQTWEDLQDPEGILETSRSLLTRLSEQGGKLDGLGVTGQMHGVLYVGSMGQSVSPLFTWQDGRGDLDYENGLSYAEFLASSTGYRMATGFGLATHFYNLKHNLVPQGAVSFCTIADYVAMRLCGLSVPVMHASMAHSLGMFDLGRGQFDECALRAAGIENGLLPQVSTEEIRVGETEDGIPVCIPIGDNQASFLGSVKPGSNVLLNIGTGSQISVLSKKDSDLPMLETRPYVSGAYLLVGSALCGGSAYRLLKDFFEQTLQDLGGLEIEDLYERMETLGESAYPTVNPLIVDPRFKGSRSDPEIRGAIRNVGMDNFTPGSLIAGVLRGMVDELKLFYDHLPESLRAAEFIVGSGNAIRRNALLRRIISDRFGKELRISEYDEEAAMGAAFLAGSMVEE